MFSEKQHFSAILISHPILSNSNHQVKDIFVGDIELLDVKKSSENSTITHIHYIVPETKYLRFQHSQTNGKTEPRKRPKKISKGNSNFFCYDCYIVEFFSDISKQRLMFFGAPFKELLKDAINSSLPKVKSEKVSFHYVDLSGLVKILRTTVKSPSISISRMNLQVTGEMGLRSLALYGEDVLLSSVYGSESVQRYTKPSSLRMNYSDDPSRMFALSTDRFGNWSFYLRKKNELSTLNKIFDFLISNNLLHKTFNDPRLRRSAQDEVFGSE